MQGNGVPPSRGHTLRAGSTLTSAQVCRNPLTDCSTEQEVEPSEPGAAETGWEFVQFCREGPLLWALANTFTLNLTANTQGGSGKTGAPLAKQSLLLLLPQA